MKNILKSRSLAWSVAIVAGVSFGAMRPAPSVALLQQAPVVGKPAVRFDVAPDGNEARYRIQEQLAGLDLPNDAVGATEAITGRIVLDKDNRIVRDSSKFTVDLASLTSDKSRRDGYVRSRTLEVAKYPTAVFVPFEARGLPQKLPASGQVTFQLAGELTLHGVTRLTLWNVTAQATANSYTGTAKTAFVFKDFGLTQPRVPIVLSVEDTIQLEYDFRLVKTN